MFKKFIAYILTVSVLLSMLVVNVSAADEEISAERVTKFENAVTLLTKLGAISAEETFNFDTGISKAKFIDIMSKIVPVSDGSKVPAFGDVPETHEYYKVIQGFADAGYVNGNGGSFEPDRDITYNEALYITMNTMGYKDFMAVVGAYPTGGWKIADQLDIKMKHKGAVAGDIFYMLHQALVTDVLTITGMKQGSFMFSNKGGETLLEKYHEITSTSGILQSNGDFSIIAGYEAQDGVLVIDGISYNTEEPCEILAGCKVDLFYDIESNDPVCVLASADNTILEIKSEDVEGYLNRRYTYREEGSKKSFKIDDSTIIVKNNLLAPAIPNDILDAAALMEPVNGKIIAVNNGGSGYDVVYIKDYISFLVSAVEKESDISNNVVIKADTRYNIENVVAYSEVNETPVYDSEGNRIAAEDISIGTVASVMGNLVDGNIIAEEIIISESIVTGTLTTIYKGDEPYLVIDDVQYSVADRIAANLLESLSPQMDMTFFTDFMGNIVALDSSLSGSMAYGYLISAKISPDDEGDYHIIAEIFSEIGSIIKYKLSNKRLQIDRDYYKDTEPTVAALDVILSRHFGTNPTVLADIGKLVRYDVNDDREINKMDFPRALAETIEPTTDDRLYISVDNLDGSTTGMTQFYGSKKAFGDKVHVDEDTLIFKLPDVDRDKDESEYKIIRNIGGLKDGRYGVQAYKLGKDMMYAKVVVLRELLSPGLSGDHIGNMMVKKITRVLNEYDEETYSITLIGMDGEKTYQTKTKAVGDNPVDLNDEVTSNQNPPLVPGDIVRCYLTEDETSIAKIAICYNFRNAGMTESTKTGDWVAENGTFGDGYVYAMDDKRIGIAGGATPTDIDTVLEDDEYSTYLLDSYKIFKVQTTGLGISRRVLDIIPATKADLRSFKLNGENCSRVVAISSRGTGQLMFIIE